MESPVMRLVIGVLVMLLAIAGILIRFDKMPGVRLHQGTNGFEFTTGGGQGAAGGDDGRADGSKPTLGDDLRLGGVSGNPARRLVIVNNQTLAVGEMAQVEIRGERVNVLCQEIRTKSAIIQVEGEREPVEIFLHGAKPARPVVTAPLRNIDTNHLTPASGPADLVAVELEVEKARIAGPEAPTNAVIRPLGDDAGPVENLVDGQPSLSN